ncbi:MAG TPA: AAA family ATPase [Terriglobales bacterium]
MLLKSLSIRGLYRTLTLDVEFNEEITLLVGINGSGKTSVINVIEWLLKPDFRRLALEQYDSLTLKFEENNINYKLAARKSSENVILSIDGPQTPLKPITISLTMTAAKDDEDAEELYRGLAPEKHEIPMYELLKSFSKPTVITLDRTISAESEEVFYVDPRSAAMRRRARSRSPMAYVQEVTSSRYAEFRTRAIANDDELKAKIVMSALQDPEMPFRGGAIKPMTRQEITGLEEKVSTYLSATIKSTDVRKQVQRFFNASRLVTERQHGAKGQHDLVNFFIVAQYRQIESLAKAFNDFEKKNASAFKSLNDYLAAVNRFLNDSNKELFFDESTGKLAFSVTNAPDKKQSGQSITHLSSGERQILVLFTFLAFASNPKSVFIIDEPELSLHPKWQSDFMDEFLKLRPEETQLLLATHSPDIVGKYKGSCVALRVTRS